MCKPDCWKVNARKVSEHIVLHILLHTGQHSHRLVRVPMQIRIYGQNHLQWACENQNWTNKQWKKWSVLNHIFFYIMWMVAMCASLIWGRDGIRIHCGKMTRHCDSLGNVLLGYLGSSNSCGCYTHLLPINCCWPSTPLRGNGISNECGLFQKDNAPCFRAKKVSEWFEEHYNIFEVLIWPNSPDISPVQQKSDPWRPHPET